jgi:hypothetical protein
MPIKNRRVGFFVEQTIDSCSPIRQNQQGLGKKHVLVSKYQKFYYEPPVRSVEVKEELWFEVELELWFLVRWFSFNKPSMV